MDHDAQQREILTLDNSQRFHLPPMNPIPPAPTPAPKRTHELKTWPPYFGRVMSGEKTFEVRKNDRGYKVGDELWLREWDPSLKEYSGRELRRTISYMLAGGSQFGIEEGTCVLALAQSPAHSAQEAAERAANELLNRQPSADPRSAIIAIILPHIQAVPAQSPGSGEALREALEEVAAGSQLCLDNPAYRLSANLCDKIRSALAHPPSVKIGDGKDGGEKPPAEEAINPRKMARGFLTAPLHVKLDIAKQLGLRFEGDVQLNDVEMCKRYFAKAGETKQLLALQRLILAHEAASPQADAGREEK